MSNVLPFDRFRYSSATAWVRGFLKFAHGTLAMTYSRSSLRAASCPAS